MSNSAGVFSLEALKDLKACLCQFGTDASDALCAVQLQIHRTFDWLQDQSKFWQREIRDLEEEVTEAKTELAARKFPNALGRIPDCTVQEEALELAQRRLAEAEEKLEKVRRWHNTLLPYAVTEYEGPSRQLANFLDGELPRAIALMDRKIGALDAYVGMTPPTTPSAPSVAAPPPVEAHTGVAPIPAASPPVPVPETSTEVPKGEQP